MSNSKMRVYKTSEAVRQKALEYYYKNRERRIAEIVARQSTPEGKERRKKQYRARGTAYAVAKTNEWRQKNPEKFKKNYTAYVNRRRARLVVAPGEFNFESWMSKVEFHGWRCLYCTKQLDERTLTIDHKIPLSKGGSNWVANLVPACGPCNSRKAAKCDFFEVAPKIRDTKFEDVDL